MEMIKDYLIFLNIVFPFVDFPLPEIFPYFLLHKKGPFLNTVHVMFYTYTYLIDKLKNGP